MNPILLAMPLRGRGWALPKVADGLAGLDTKGLSVKAYFRFEGPANHGFVERVADAHPEWLPLFASEPEPTVRVGRPWKAEGYRHMATVRDRLLAEARFWGASMFSVDSDIVVRPDTLKRLISHNKPIVSALVRNHAQAQAYNMMMFDGTRFTRRGIDRDLHGSGLLSCSLTGACYLIDRSVVWDRDVRYVPDKQGEDAGFCRTATAAGFSIFCDTDSPVAHLMAPGVELS